MGAEFRQGKFNTIVPRDVMRNYVNSQIIQSSLYNNDPYSGGLNTIDKVVITPAVKNDRELKKAMKEYESKVEKYTIVVIPKIVGKMCFNLKTKTTATTKEYNVYNTDYTSTLNIRTFKKKTEMKKGVNLSYAYSPIVYCDNYFMLNTIGKVSVEGRVYKTLKQKPKKYEYMSDAVELYYYGGFAV